MKRIACTCCGGRAEFQHETRPAIFMCFQCARDVIEFMRAHHVVNGNPLAAEILRGTSESLPGNRYRIWTRSKYEANAWSELIFEIDDSGRFKESNPAVDNLLDFVG